MRRRGSPSSRPGPVPWIPHLRFAACGKTALLTVWQTERVDLPQPQGHFTTGGMEERIDSILPPVLKPNIVPLS